MDTGFTATEAWAIASVGFGSAVLGAVAGFLGTQYQTFRANAARKNGVLTALAGELVENSNAALIASLGNPEPIPSYSSAVWRDGKFEVAHFVSKEVFTLLLGIYSNIRLIEDASGKLRDGHKSQVETIRMWYETIRNAQGRLLDEAKVPGLRGWNKMEPFHAEMARFESQTSR